MEFVFDTQTICTDTYATIGFFDGVHRGHCYLLDELKRRAAQAGLPSLVVSFADSPACVLSPENGTKLLTTPMEKTGRLRRQGLDYCLMLDFNEKLVKMTAGEFLSQLKRHFGVRRLLLGYDHRFGSDGLRSFAEYKCVADKVGVVLEQAAPFSVGGEVVGSRVIRTLLTVGCVEQANLLLGYNYELTGRVEHGRAIGRTIGFPTANLTVSPRKLLPKNGVYAVDVILNKSSYKGLLNIGVRPTVADGMQTVEVHIVGFSGNVYGQNITVALRRRLRDERKFDSLEALEKQIEIDKNSLFIDEN